MRFLQIHKIIDSLIVFMLIMSTGGLLFVFNRNTMYILFISLIIFALLFTYKSIKKNLFYSFIITWVLLIVLFLINYYFAFSSQDQNKYQYYLFIITLSILVLFHFSNNRIDDVFVKRLYFVLKLIVFHAFIQVFLYLIVKDNLNPISSSSYECRTFKYMFYYASLDFKSHSVVSLFGIEIVRNQGLFWEAGVAQVFFNILFFLEAFIVKKNRVILLITAIVIITTYSTIGIAILLLQVIVYFIAELKKNLIFIPIGLILLMPVYSLFTANFEEKLYGEKEASFQKRYFDLVQPLFIGLESPLTGIGLDLNRFQEYRSEFYINSTTFNLIQEQVGLDLKMENTSQGSANSFMFLLAAMGFPTTLIFIYMLLNQQLINKRKRIFLSIVILSLFSSPLLLRPFFLIFIISGFTHYFHRVMSHKQQLA